MPGKIPERPGEGMKSLDSHCSRIIMVLAFAIGFTTAGCTATITREDLLRQMQEGTAPLIVDVRSQGEYDRDHLPGALHIPFYAINSGLGEVGHAKNEPLVLYCEHGPRAGIAGFSLFLAGHDKVYFLEGHMKGWRKSSFPIEIVSHGSPTF
jgi:rhodanese-related sulfurtransferase